MIKIQLQKYIYTILAIVSIFFNLSFAQEKEAIENFHMYVYINEEGNAHVIENIIYKFQEEVDGITRSIHINNFNGIDNIKAYELYPEKKNLEIDIFNEKDIFDFRVYNQSKYETKIFKIEYDLKDVVHSYVDTDEFSWRIFDKRNIVNFKNIDIHIYLPQKIEINNLKAFQHGFLDANIFIKDNEITYSIEKDIMKDAFEIRILFPKKLIQNKRKQENLFVYDKIIKEEKKIEEDYNRKKKYIRIYNMAGVIFFVFEWIAGIIIYVKSNGKSTYNLKRSYYAKIPSDCSPAMMSCIVHLKKIHPKDVISTILDLTRRKHIHIQEINNSEKKDYVLEVLEENADHLKKHEKYLIKWIFYTVGRNKSISLSQIESFNEDKDNFLKFKKYYYNWKHQVIKECEEYRYFKKKNSLSRICFIGLGILEIIIGIGYIGIYRNYEVGFIGTLCFMIGGTISFLYGWVAKRSIIGHKEYKKWMAFKKFLINFKNIKFKDKKAIQIYEQYIIYSISLGIYQRILSKFKHKLKIEKEKNNIYLNLDTIHYVLDQEEISIMENSFKINELETFLKHIKK